MNREKTFTRYATKIKFLGFGFYKSKTGWHPTVHAKSKAKPRKRVRERTSRRRVNSLRDRVERQRQYVRGWVQHFKLAHMSAWLKEADMWMRRRIRIPKVG